MFLGVEMIEEMLIGAGIFVLGTLFGYICTRNSDEFGLMMENAILKHQLDECRCDKEKEV